MPKASKRTLDVLHQKIWIRKQKNYTLPALRSDEELNSQNTPSPINPEIIGREQRGPRSRAGHKTVLKYSRSKTSMDAQPTKNKHQWRKYP